MNGSWLPETTPRFVGLVQTMNAMADAFDYSFGLHHGGFEQPEHYIPSPRELAVWLRQCAERIECWTEDWAT